MICAVLDENKFVVALHDLPEVPEHEGRLQWVQANASIVLGDYWNGATFISVNSHPSTISGTTLLADSLATVAIFDIPIPARIILDGEFVVKMDDPEDTDFEFTVDFPGVYSIIVESPPYKSKEFIVEALCT
jgi:hypothetical protein